MIFIYGDLVKNAGLTCCERKKMRLQMYLIHKLSMRYDVNLFKFILNLIEVVCLVQERMNMASWEIEIDCKN